MSYQLKEQKIIPGGLNLLAPGDQVAEGDCLDLRHWWPGSAGRLEQSPSLLTKNSPTVVSVQHSICQADGRIYYGGTDGNLRQIGRGVNDAAIDTGYDTTPLGMISYQGYVWIMNRAASKQRKDDGTTTSDWTPAAPSAPTLYDLDWDGSAAGSATPNTAVGNPPEVGGLLDGQAYYYYTTWQYGTLGESNPSTVATITPAPTSPHEGSIVRVVVGTAPSTATGWNIYRKVGPTPYRLNEGVIDIARTYVDDYGDEVHTHSDTQMLQLGIIMEDDHDAAPAARVIADQVYNGRILVASSSTYPNRIWYTPALQPAFFRGSGNPNDGDWVDVGTDKGDAVLAMICHPGMVIIYRQRSIWRQVGDFGELNARLEVVVPDLGTVSVRGAVSTSLGDYFIGMDGVYKFNNDWAQKTSQKVEPVFRGLATGTLPTLGTAYRSQMAIGYKNGRLWVSYADTGGTLIASMIYDVLTQRWFNSGDTYGAFLDTGTDFLGAGTGVFSVENSYSNLGSQLGYQSEFQDCGAPDHEKTFADLVIDHNTQGATITITIRTNKKRAATDSFVLTTITSSVQTRDVIPLVYPSGYTTVALRGLPIRAFDLSVRLTGSGASTTPVTIDSPILLHYYLEARQGKVFDTDETNHGMPGMVKTVDEVEFDIDSTAGAGVLQIYSDIPGGAMAARLGGGVAIAQTAGRQTIRIVLSSPIDGSLLRYVATTTTSFCVYGFRARVTPIGVHVDGTVSEVWDTRPMPIAG